MTTILQQYTRKIGSATVIVACLFSSSSCSVLPDYLTFGDKKLTSSSINQTAGTETEETALNTRDVGLSSSHLSQELQSAVNEWQSLKPSINRLVELENDLSYLLVQLGDVASTPMLEVSANTTNGTFGSEEAMAAKFDVAEKFEADEPVSIELAKAEPIMDLKASSATSTFKALDATASVDNANERQKFATSPQASTMIRGATVAARSSRLTGPNPNQTLSQANTANIDNVTLSKFANVTRSAKNATAEDKFVSGIANNSRFNNNLSNSGTDNCQRATSNTTVNEGLAIHLASFKSEKLAQDSLREFENKYQDITCNKSPIIKTVIVQNVTYHSARLGPYQNRSEAEAACRAVRSVQSYCAVTAFDGVVQ